jgi:hypothetical protein
MMVREEKEKWLMSRRLVDKENDIGGDQLEKQRALYFRPKIIK